MNFAKRSLAILISVTLFFQPSMLVQNNAKATQEAKETAHQMTEVTSTDNFVSLMNERNENVILEQLHPKAEDFSSKRLIVKTQVEVDEMKTADSIIKLNNLYFLEYTTEKETKEAYGKLKVNTDIEYVEIDILCGISDVEPEIGSTIVEQQNLTPSSEEITKGELLIPTEPTKENQMILFPKAKEGKKKITVAVIDTGCNDTERVEKGISFFGDSISDDNGHGTAITRLILENTPQNVTVLPIKALNENGIGTISNLYSAVQYALAQNVDIINLSLVAKATIASSCLTELIDSATAKGVIVTVAAGNQGADIKNYTPANIKSATTVTAVDETGIILNSSNFGEGVDYSAPGKSGTSQATALVSSMYANLICANHSPDELVNYANSKAPVKKYGRGLLSYNMIKLEDGPIDVEIENNVKEKTSRELTTNEEFAKRKEYLLQKDYLTSLEANEYEALLLWEKDPRIGINYSDVKTYEMGNDVEMQAIEHWVVNVNSSGSINTSGIPSKIIWNAETRKLFYYQSEYNGKLYWLPTSYKPGFTFLGWWSASSGGFQYKTSTSTPVSGSGTFDARWKVDTPPPTPTHKQTVNYYYMSAATGSWTYYTAASAMIEQGKDFYPSWGVTPSGYYNYQISPGKTVWGENTYEVYYYPNSYNQTINHYLYKPLKGTYTLWNTVNSGALYGGVYTPTYLSAPQGYQIHSIDPAYTVYGNTTRNVYYSPNTYTTSFNLMGGSCEISSPFTYLFDEVDTVAMTNRIPTKQGYIFGGWSKTEGGATWLAPGQGFPQSLAENCTLYAKWIPRNDTPYKVLYCLTNLDGETYMIDKTINAVGTTDEKITEVPTSYAGYETPMAITTPIKPDGSSEYYFIYKRNKYQLELDMDKSFLLTSGAGTYTFGETITIDANLKAGYAFESWENMNTLENILEKSYTFVLGSSNVKFLANGKARTDTPWTVLHKIMKLDGTTYELRLQENNKGTTDTMVTPNTKDYEGFTSPEKKSINVDGNGTGSVTYLYERNKYNLNLSYGIGIKSVQGKGDYYFEQDVSIDAELSPGYKFSYWEDTENHKKHTSKFNTWQKEAKNISLKAVASPISYDITYELNGGTIVGEKNSYNIESNDIVLPTPTRAGYTFIGWESEFSESAELIASIETGSYGNKHYSALWSPNQYDITFDRGDNIVIPDIKINYNEEYSLGSIPVRSGYQFDGWYQGEKQFEPTGTWKYEKNINLTAKWKSQKDTPYVIENKLMTLSGDTYESVSTNIKYGETDSKIAEKPMKYEGFESPEAQEVTIKGDGSTKITFLYRRNSYRLNFVSNKGASIQGEEGVYLYGTPLQLTGTATDGYYWFGFKVNDAFIQDASYNFTMPGKDITVEAMGTAQDYHINYDLRGGTLPGEYATSFNSESSFVLPTPKRDGYEFVGWTGSNGIVPERKVLIDKANLSDLHYTANWNYNALKVKVPLVLRSDSPNGISFSAVVKSGTLVVSLPGALALKNEEAAPLNNDSFMKEISLSKQNGEAGISIVDPNKEKQNSLLDIQLSIHD